MSFTNATIRNRIEAQGFCGLDDDTYRQINLPLRIAPTICLVWTAIGRVICSGTSASPRT